MSTYPRSTADSIGGPSEQVRELSATVPGASTDELLHNLLKSLSSLLGVRRAYVTETVRDGRSRTIAAWEDGERGPVREYSLAGTPCATVLRSGLEVVDCALAERYELETGSLGDGCDSFVGSAIVDRNGERIGQLCAFGAKPLRNSKMASALVSLAAIRVSAELEYRRHEDSLRRQQQNLEVLLGNLPGMVYRSDFEKARRVRFASQGCRPLTGYAGDRLVADAVAWNGLVHEDDRDRVWNEIRSAAGDGRSYEVQYRIITRAGEVRWVWERGSAVDNDDANATLEGFVSDATALKESQEALARSEAHSKAIVETAAEGIVTYSAEGRIQSVNLAAEGMFGYPGDELVGEDVGILFAEPVRGNVAEYFERDGDIEARHKDGSTFSVELMASEVTVGDERCFAGIIRDISDQKAAERSLREAEQRFRAVFDQRLQLACILSPAGEVLEANLNSLDFAGLERDALIGLRYWDTPWWSHSKELQQQMREAIDAAANGVSLSFEASCTRSDGSLATLDFSVRPITDTAGEIVFLVTESHDITEQKATEEEARVHRERLAHVTRLSTLGEMAAGIAHEINQPLTAISLFAQAARRLVQNGDFERLGEACDKMNEHSLRASEVVERMQAMARRGESTRELVDCNALIETAVKLAESEARIHDLEIAFEKDDDPAPVFVDGVQIQQVALNLLRNSMEAVLANGEAQAGIVAIRTRRIAGDRVEVAVTDNGPGVADQHVGRLFTPFATTKKAGMGMGLSISKAIVRAHGGQIDFRNNESVGVTFWFTLPLSKRGAHYGR